jgi:hypothetical protein
MAFYPVLDTTERSLALGCLSWRLSRRLWWRLFKYFFVDTIEFCARHDCDSVWIFQLGKGLLDRLDPLLQLTLQLDQLVLQLFQIDQDAGQ